MTKIRLGVAQVRQTAHIDLNFEKIVEYLERAGGEGVDILHQPRGGHPTMFHFQRDGMGEVLFGQAVDRVICAKKEEERADKPG